MAGKVINTILFNDDDMRAVAEGQFSFTDALDWKLREAAEAGTPFSPLRDPVSGRPFERQYGSSRTPQAKAVIVEGNFDVLLIHALADVLGPSKYQLEVVPAGGPSNLAALASAAINIGVGNSVVIIADGDGRPDAIRQRLENDLASRSPDFATQVDILILDPSFEEALGVLEGFSAGRRRVLSSDRSLLDNKVREADVRHVAARKPEVRRLLEALGLS